MFIMLGDQNLTMSTLFGYPNKLVVITMSTLLSVKYYSLELNFIINLQNCHHIYTLHVF